MATMINCPFCGKLTDPKLENCPHCGGATPQRAEAHPVRKAPRRGRQTCPNCRALVQDGDIICLVCHTNLLTGQKVAKEAPPQSNSRAIIIAGSIFGVLTLIVGVLWVYSLRGDPFERARRLIREGDFLAAQDVLTTYIERQPDDDRALFELGKLEWRAGRYIEAAASFERAANLNPALQEAGMWNVAALGRSSQSKNTRAKQVSALTRLLERDQNNSVFAYLLGLAQTGQIDLSSQAEQLRVAVELDPADVTTRWGLGIVLGLMGDYEAADREMRMTAANDVRGADVLAARAFLATLEGDREKAIQFFLNALEAEGLTLRWQTETELGKLLVEEGRFREAEAHLAVAIDRKPNNDLARYLSGMCAEALNRPRDALREFGPLASRSGPYSSASAVQIAHIRLNMDEVAEAEDALKRSGGVRELNAAYYTVQGRIHAARNRDSAAREAFRKAVEVDPNYAPSYLEDGLLHIENDELKMGLLQLERYVALLGKDIAGTRVYEVRALIRQLHQTVGGDGDGRELGSGSIAGRVAS